MSDSPGSRRFLILLALYLIPHTIIRLLLWKSLEFDEAEQLLFAQSLALGYSPQPPLYTWLLWPVVQVAGANVFALTMLKMGLLAGIYVLLYRLALRLLHNEHLACLAAFTPLLVQVFAWEAIRMITHTALLCLCCLATVLTLFRLRERGRTADFALLGVWAGLGMLAKYNYALFAASLFGAALVVESFRARVLDRRLVLSVGVAVALFAAHGVWLADHWGEAHDYVLKYSRTEEGTLRGKGALAGIGNLAWNLGLALAAPALAALAFLPGGFRARREVGTAGDDRRLLGWSFLIALGLLVALVVAGVRGYRAHWFAPFLLLLPVWFFGRLGDAPLPRWRVGGYAGALGVAAVGVLLVRSAMLGFDYDEGKYQTRDFLYAEVAARVRELGMSPRTVLVHEPVSGGYQLLYFPDAEVVCLPYRSGPVRSEGDGPVLVVWDSTHGDWLPRRLAEHLAQRFGGARSSVRLTHIEGNQRVFKSSTRRLGYLVLSGGPGA